MLLSSQKSFIFVANTKTASTSLETALKPFAEIHHGGDPRRKHASIRDVGALFPRFFAEAGRGPEAFFRFGVMRDPLDWLGSWFRFRKGNDVESPLPEDMDFAGFWAQGDWNIRRANGEPYLQRQLFCNANGALQMDMIIPYERLSGIFSEICGHLGVRAPLPRENVSKLSEFALPETIAPEVRAHLAPDYALYRRLDEINARGMAKLKRLTER